MELIPVDFKPIVLLPKLATSLHKGQAGSNLTPIRTRSGEALVLSAGEIIDYHRWILTPKGAEWVCLETLRDRP